MLRAIAGYHQDDQSDWVAELACRHDQHVRHQPPLVERVWVTTEEGRRGMLGTQLECVRCDRLELPEDVIAYSKTKTFTATDVPESLLASHRTKERVWGLIHVLSGRLRYVVDDTPARAFDLDRDHPGVIAPEAPHHLELDGPAQFFVEFLR
jgi:tellurite methyltransferase